MAMVAAMATAIVPSNAIDTETNMAMATAMDMDMSMITDKDQPWK